MKKGQNNASCISCIHYDDDTRICTHGAGLLREIELSESMAEAEHGCKEYEERVYRLSPESLLKIALEESKVRVSFDKAKLIFDKFMDSMIKNGYIQENKKVD